jgi:hypothetical protein
MGRMMNMSKGKEEINYDTSMCILVQERDGETKN